MPKMTQATTNINATLFLAPFLVAPSVKLSNSRLAHNDKACFVFDVQAGLGPHLVEIIALILLPVAIGMCGYAIFIFKWRSDMISKKRVSRGLLICSAGLVVLRIVVGRCGH